MTAKHYDLRRAMNYARAVHLGSKRLSGDPYFQHPVAVMKNMEGKGFSDVVLMAAVLHDVLEESDEREKTEQEIYQYFGEEVYFLVSALSKDFSIRSKERRDRAYREQLSMAMQRDSAIIFIKMADLIHNASTIEHLTARKQEIWIGELKEFYLFHFLANFHLVPEHQRPFYMELLNRLQAIVMEYDREHDMVKMA